MFNNVFLIELVSQPPQIRECVVVVVVVIVVYFFVCVFGLFIFK